MHRLALAIAAAISLHVLLLMIVVPEPQVRKPEIMGSGQVTVSIIHSIPEREPLEVVKEQEPPETTEEVEQILQDDTDELPSEMPIEKNIQDQVPKEEKVQEKVPIKRFERSKATKELAGENTKEQKIAEPVESETSLFSSAIETLQDPRPIEPLNRPPEYPALARKRGWEGTVILEVDIRSDGMVKDVQIQQSSSFKILDNAALRAVRKWEFQPGSKAGKFIDMKVLVPVHFLLKEE